jgi:hypothetical protein
LIIKNEKKKGWEKPIRLMLTASSRIVLISLSLGPHKLKRKDPRTSDSRGNFHEITISLYDLGAPI